MEYVGIEFELSNFALIVYFGFWNSGRSIALSITNKTWNSDRSVLYSGTNIINNDNQSVESISGILCNGTYRCYCKRASVSTEYNRYIVYGHIFR